MINLVRKIVAGPKNRTIDQQYDLDLTYITNNIIAMAFPASGFQKTYRNSIDDVANFLKQKHQNNFLIINASNRKYQYEKFNFQVLEFFWTDHQAPPLTTLFQVCEKMSIFIKQNEKNVVAVHCNHGKGRTGTAIIAYLLYSGLFSTVQQTLKFYNAKRFSGTKYGVDQPCQLRYLNYFKAFMELPLEKIKQPLKAFKLHRFQQKGLKEKQVYLRISQTRTQNVIYPCVPPQSPLQKFSRPLFNDIFIELFEQNWSGSKQILRINFNLFFLGKRHNSIFYEVIFRGQQIKMKLQVPYFQLILEFQQYCSCHQSPKIGVKKQFQCLCQAKRERQQVHWDTMVKNIQKNKQRLKNQQEKLVQQK